MNIIITGASKGIGKAIAEKFASDKARHTIFLCSRNEKDLEVLAKELQENFEVGNVHYKASDLSNKEEATAFAGWALSLVDRVDVLVNNVGTFIQGNISDEPDGALEKMLAVNLYSAYHTTRALLPAMKKAKSGHIFTICSIASLHAYPNGGAYSISKFALYGFTKNLREELKPYGVKVTAVLPGAVYTDSWKGSGVAEERIMEPDDIAKVIYSAAHLSPQATIEEIVIRPQLGDL